MPTKDSNGDHILSQGSLLKAWNKFLAAKFDCPPSDLNRSQEATVSPHDSLSDQELSEALASLKSGKAPGIDRIPIEAYQQSSAAREELFRITELIWETEVVPEDSVLRIFIMLYKKKGPQ